MANLYLKKDPTTNITLGCYSERGLISFLMLKWLTDDKDNINKFIDLLKNKNGKNPLENFKPNNITIFTELVLGFKGFGCPDGLLYLENKKKEKRLIFIEAKINENVEESCKKKSNSSLNNQIKLKMMMLYQYFKNPNSLTIEINNRKLELKEGVKKIFEYIGKFEKKQNNIFFLIITTDKENPIKKFKQQLNDQEFETQFEDPELNEKFSKYINKICWIRADTLIEMLNLEIFS